MSCRLPGLRSRSGFGAVVVSAALLLPALAGFAADGVSPSGGPGASPAMMPSALRVVGALAMVTALLLGGVWLLRNWQRFGARNAPGSHLNVLEVRHIGQRHALYVVSYGPERLLLSASPAGVSLLCHLPSVTGTVVPMQTTTPLDFPGALAKALGR